MAKPNHHLTQPPQTRKPHHNKGKYKDKTKTKKKTNTNTHRHLARVDVEREERIVGRAQQLGLRLEEVGHLRWSPGLRWLSWWSSRWWGWGGWGSGGGGWSGGRRGPLSSCYLCHLAPEWGFLCSLIPSCNFFKLLNMICSIAGSPKDRRKWSPQQTSRLKKYQLRMWCLFCSWVIWWYPGLILFSA